MYICKWLAKIGCTTGGHGIYVLYIFQRICVWSGWKWLYILLTFRCASIMKGIIQINFDKFRQ